MTAIYVDADACPVKDEAVRVAARHRLKTFIVSNGGIRPRPEPMVETVIVADGLDAADDWIAERCAKGDVVITNDIPLAARAVANGARVLNPVSHFKLQRHDGETWREVLPAVEGNDNPAWSATFAPVKTKYLRLVITRTPHNISRVWEVEFYQPLKNEK